jgi:hypothetical protein
MAVVLHGNGSEKVQQRMQQVMSDIEEEYSDVLEDWDGDLDKMRGIKERSSRLLRLGLLMSLSDMWGKTKEGLEEEG